MITAETLWLRGQAAQQNLLHIANYNSAFVSTAMIQAMQLTISAPSTFWSAVGRASETAGDSAVVALKPKPAPKAKPKAAKPAAAPKPKPAAKKAAPPLKAVPDVAVAPEPTPAPKPKAKPAAEQAPSPAKAVKAAAPKPVEAAKPTPKPEPAPAPVETAKMNPQLLDAPRGGAPDDLTSLAGVGPKLATSLNEFGIYHYDQLAALNEEGIDWLDEQQKGFKMLAARYDIVGQAKAVS